MTNIIKIVPIVLIGLLTMTYGCKNQNAENQEVQDKPAQEIIIEDKKAEEMVAAMEMAMGGREKWDELRYVSWTFFGARHLVWDKIGGRVRIDSPRDTSVYLVDLNALTGKVIKGGKEITDSKKLDELLQRGKSIWINDSYWMFMPFKLRDPGVTVNYVREDTLPGGFAASVLALTFNEVGDTPDNKYEVYIDKTDQLIKQWAFFKDANQESPPRVWPWDNYQSFEGLLLSADRSDKSGPSNVRVYPTLSDKVFNSFEAFDYY